MPYIDPIFSKIHQKLIKKYNKNKKIIDKNNILKSNNIKNNNSDNIDWVTFKFSNNLKVENIIKKKNINKNKNKKEIYRKQVIPKIYVNYPM